MQFSKSSVTGLRPNVTRSVFIHEKCIQGRATVCQRIVSREPCRAEAVFDEAVCRTILMRVATESGDCASLHHRTPRRCRDNGSAVFYGVICRLARISSTA